jgi:parallel beta-helix repeat protein
MGKKSSRLKALFFVCICILLVTSSVTAPNLSATSAAASKPYFGLQDWNIDPRNFKDGTFDFTVSLKNGETAACRNGNVVFGGAADAGGVDGKNSAAVINAAIAALEPYGGRIEVLAGNYLVLGKICMGSNVVLYCDGEANFILGYNGVAFEFDGVRDASLVCANVEGDKNLNFGTPIVIQDNSIGNTIAYNHLLGSGARGITVQGSGASNNTLAFNIIKDTAAEGIMVSRSSNNLILDNLVNKTGLHGIVVTGGNCNNITGNYVEDAGGNYVSGFAHGIAVDGNEGKNPCFGNIVNCNVVVGAYMAGIEVADTADYSNITNNYVTRTRDYGIYFGGALASSCHAVISNNTVDHCGISGDQGIMVSGCSADNYTRDVAVIDNVVDGAGLDGIHFKWVTDSKIQGNVCLNCKGYGLTFQNSSGSKNTIDANDLKSNRLGEMNLEAAQICYLGR